LPRAVRAFQDLRYLDRLVAQRVDAVTLLERCLYAAYLGHRRPTVRVGFMGEEVDATRYYYHVLNELNAAVEKEQEVRLDARYIYAFRRRASPCVCRGVVWCGVVL